MKRNNDLYKKKCDLYDSLFIENSIDGILNIAENFLENPIFILDTSYRIITRSTLASSDNSSIEQHNGENYLLLETISLMKKNKCIDTIYKTNTSFFYYSDQDLIFCSIKVNDITVGYISILQSKRNFQQEDLEITDILSNIISIQIQKENLFISNSGLNEEYYLINLLENDIDDIEYIEERLKSSNFTLNKNLLIISIPFKQKYKDFRHNFGLNQLITGIKKIFINCISVYYKDTIISLISNNSYCFLTDNAKENLIDFLRLNNLRCGASNVFENLSEIKDYFYQSLYALEITSNLQIDDKINYFENYIDYYLLHIAAHSNTNLNKINLSTLIHPWITKLIEFDVQNKTQLFKTLKAYFENNRNANEASKKLNIHRSTFFYRFNKIQNLLNISLDHCNNLFNLELSIKIIDYTDFNLHMK